MLNVLITILVGILVGLVVRNHITLRNMNKELKEAREVYRLDIETLNLHSEHLKTHNDTNSAQFGSIELILNILKEQRNINEKSVKFQMTQNNINRTTAIFLNIPVPEIGKGDVSKGTQ